MSDHASATKRNRQRIVRTVRNKSIRTSMRNSLKSAREAIAAGDSAAAEEPVRKVSIALARAVTQGVLHKKTASRTISRIQSAFAKLG